MHARPESRMQRRELVVLGTEGTAEVRPEQLIVLTNQLLQAAKQDAALRPLVAQL